MVDAKRMPSMREPMAIAVGGALGRPGPRLPSSFLFAGRELLSPSSTTSTLVLARQTISLSPSALGLLF